MTLHNKNAVIYGAGGSIGGAVSLALAAAGARVFLTGHRLASLQKVAKEIEALGGQAEIAEVNALDPTAINEHIHSVVREAGSVDLSFNLINTQDTQDIPLVEMSLDDFTRPINIAMETHFLTTTAAARVMMKQGSGVILSLTATPGGTAYPLVGGFGPACCALEGFSRDLATELGPHGVRVVNIRSAGSPDSRPFTEALANGGAEVAAFIKKLEDDTMLKKLPMMNDIANVAVFLTSDLSGKITGVTIDVTAGTTNALNYKAARVPFVFK
ncbi:SDR family NAD(P)-dependent oxidoreductase [Pedobacter heparinus]|uniref:Short-chain dehydrogenase/reductase SDR n=1 Tax=Pedobacter heparinus (strain ATCC 13125 / DSM 2366 / CIP 104194 / JCM 7457 / NBRC 12017 / NCIMB 9290 / NRRL B-14731 / HIM 762-3) TaxID=485917 RepID=C6XSZ3_PEDHD|nr:SDR family oxidoreductase [Pedobacter heparinus]ACU03554.1 short-chain dehydrogenase/reductase SDR [Pedobacter heparinus DSM 2366]